MQERPLCRFGVEAGCWVLLLLSVDGCEKGCIYCDDVEYFNGKIVQFVLGRLLARCIVWVGLSATRVGMSVWNFRPLAYSVW